MTASTVVIAPSGRGQMSRTDVVCGDEQIMEAAFAVCGKEWSFDTRGDR
jgi:hypothetical protein